MKSKKFTYLVIFVFYLLIFELLSFSILFFFSDYKPRSFLISIKDFNTSDYKDESCHQHIIDLELFVVHDDSIKCIKEEGFNERGFFKYNSTLNFDDSFNIITLGGSTTDGYFLNYEKFDIPYRTWPFWINQECAKLRKCKVLNGGHGGYSSTFERKKFLRHVMLQKPLPKLVISLNGVNDMPNYDSPKENIYPYYRKEQIKMLVENKFISLKADYIFLPNTLRILNFGFRQFFGLKNYHLRYQYNELLDLDKSLSESLPKASFSERSEIWAHNVKIMHGLSLYNGFDYLVFLQPTMGLNSEKIENMHPGDLKIRNLDWWNDGDYASVLNKNYEKLRLECKKLDFCIDISDIIKFDKQFQLYTDPRHQNGRGHQIIAKKIMDVLKERKIIDLK